MLHKSYARSNRDRQQDHREGKAAVSTLSSWPMTVWLILTTPSHQENTIAKPARNVHEQKGGL
ncbi:MAG: hypothetical protein M3274_07310, partial [Actinomycetota bacterium]|nr:hypothetical protein [Actinomycetota bacterium]